MTKIPLNKEIINERTIIIAPNTDLNDIAGINKISVRELLDTILNDVEPIDFEFDNKPKEKDFVVKIIDELLTLIKALGWGLIRKQGLIYIYNGAYWQQIEKDDTKWFLTEAALRMGCNKLSTSYFEFRRKLLEQLLEAAYRPISEPTKDTTLINLQNGTFEITPNGSRLRAFDRKDFLTYQLPFEYDPKAKAPTYHKYLNRVLPDPSIRRVLAEYIGYVFTKHLKLEKVLLLFGGGANGKSVFFDIINALLGRDNISNLSLSNLKEENNRVLLNNKLLNYGSEIKRNIDSDLFKNMVSGETIQARFKYKDGFQMRDYAKLAFNCNELPKEVEHTTAFFRRFLIVPFNVTIPENERNPNLAKTIIKNELAGVFCWVLDGLYRILEQNKFSDCPAIKQVLKDYRKESDTVSLFAEEKGLKHDNLNTMPLTNLFQEFRDYCQENGYRAMGNRYFAKRLRNLGYKDTRRKRGYVFFLKRENPSAVTGFEGLDELDDLF